jgi:hypothetical protein
MPTPKPEPIPATGDAYAGGYAYTLNGAPPRQSMLSGDQFGDCGPWESGAGLPLGSNSATGSSL